MLKLAISLLVSAMLIGCSYIPEIAKVVDDIETDDGIQLYIDKEAITQKGKDLLVQVQVTAQKT